MKTILITGGSTGIGAAIYKQLKCLNEYRFVVVGRNRPKEMAFDDPNAIFIEADFSDLESTQQAIDKIQADGNFSEIDILINNAGIGYFDKIENIDIINWTRLMNVNLNSTYLFIKSFIAGMKHRNFGRIINISSDADHIGFADGSAYCASKFGILGLSEAVRKELTGKNVTITAISPARVDTNFNGKKKGDRPISLHAEDIAEQVAFLINLRDNCNVETIRLKSTLE